MSRGHWSINIPEDQWSLFDEWCSFQLHSSDIIVYSILARGPVRLAWPTILIAGKEEPIPPNRLRDWLVRNGLYWPCWCSHGDDGVLPSRFAVQQVEGRQDRIEVFCHYLPSRCSFALNLQSKFHRTEHFARYEHLEYLTSEDRFEILMGPRLEAFERQQLADANGDSEEEVTLFKGYCGEFSGTVNQIEGPYYRDLDPMIVEFDMFSSLLQGGDE
ncbi:hypothetical protein MD484_g5796, partial [Candolleomyces efflorescens]